MSKTPKNRLDYFNGYRKTKRRRIELLLGQDERRLLVEAAARHHMPIGRFVAQAALGYLSRAYIVPDQDRTSALDLAMRRIGNNVNQIARQAWKDGRGGEAADAAYDLVRSLADDIECAIRQPPELLALVRDRACAHPEFLTELRQLLTELEAAPCS